MRWRGKQWDALTDRRPALNVEGALRSGKTTLALWKELERLPRPPRPAHAAGALDRGRDAVGAQADLARHPAAGGAARALEPARALRRVPQRRARLHPRAQGAGRADALREVPRPDARARLHRPGRGSAARHLPRAQGAAVAEGLPAPDRHHAAGRRGDALDREGVPADNSTPHRRYIALSVYDNAHNLDAETIRNLEETYPLGAPQAAARSSRGGAA